MARADAVVVIVEDSEGRLLGVARPGRPDDVGLPGGSIEPGETPEAAAIREVKEETGLAVTVKPWSRERYHGLTLHVFVATSFAGDLRSSHEGEASWASWDAVSRGRYGDFNRVLGERFRASRQG